MLIAASFRLCRAAAAFSPRALDADYKITLILLLIRCRDAMP